MLNVTFSFLQTSTCFMWLPRWLNSKESACQCRRTGYAGSIPGLGRSPGGNGNPLQYSCLKNFMLRGAWQATVHGVKKSQTWLSDQAHTNFMSQILNLWFFFFYQEYYQEFPGSPVVRALHSSLQRFNSWSGTKIPQTTWHGQKKKKKRVLKFAQVF